MNSYCARNGMTAVVVAV